MTAPLAATSTYGNDFDRHVAAAGIDPTDLRARREALLTVERPRMARLWAYYRNPTRPMSVAAAAAAGGGSLRPYRQAQEWGLPRRITGGGGVDLIGSPDATPRREVVIENDIGWRVDTMVDFLVGQSVTLTSAAADPLRRRAITALLRALIDQHGGLPFLQQVALLGTVCGHVDVLVKLADVPGSDPGADPRAHHSEPANRIDPSSLAGPGASDDGSLEAAMVRLARYVRLEVVDPARAVAVPDPLDPRAAQAYAVVWRAARRDGGARAVVEAPEPDPAPAAGGLRAWMRRLLPGATPAGRPGRRGGGESVTVVELLTATRWMTFHDDRLVAAGDNTLGRIPLAHVQNLPDPFDWRGAGDVAPLVPLQDELNTRLSDRAHRITMQSFRMYLGKGIEQFTEQPVAPGRMWMTDNPDAQVVEFGGDASCPSEDAHLREIREAMDKVSGVTPIAAGILRNRVGRLTSAAALRVTLLALLARTHRKRLTYGRGIAEVCELALAWLDHAGLFRTEPHERGVTIDWFDPVGAIAPELTSPPQSPSPSQSPPSPAFTAGDE